MKLSAAIYLLSLGATHAGMTVKKTNTIEVHNHSHTSTVTEMGTKAPKAPKAPKGTKVPKATKAPTKYTYAPKAPKATKAPNTATATMEADYETMEADYEMMEADYQIEMGTNAPKAPKAPKGIKSSRTPKAPGGTKAPKTSKAPGDTKAPKTPKAPKAIKSTRAPKSTKSMTFSEGDNSMKMCDNIIDNADFLCGSEDDREMTEWEFVRKGVDDVFVKNGETGHYLSWQEDGEIAMVEGKAESWSVKSMTGEENGLSILFSTNDAEWILCAESENETFYWGLNGVVNDTSIPDISNVAPACLIDVEDITN